MMTAPLFPSEAVPRKSTCSAVPRLFSPAFLMLPGLALVLGAAPLAAQLSLSSAVGLAVNASPRVKAAQDDLTKAAAGIAESKDLYIPSLVAGAGLGQGYGYSANPPTLFTFNATSLLYNSSQLTYIKAARVAYNSAARTLDDVREAVAEDAALSFLAVDHDLERDKVLTQESGLTTRLVEIVEERQQAGRDSQIDLTTAKLSAAQLRLRRLRGQDDLANDRNHLARLLGVPASSLTLLAGFPEAPVPAHPVFSSEYASPAVASAFENARAKHFMAVGDSRYLYRPQFQLVVQYNRYATFTNSFKQIEHFGGINNNIGANEGVFGVQITVPLLDRFRLQKNIESAAEASRALHEAQNAQAVALEAQERLAHSIEELDARAEVAALEQQLAQQQLDAMLVQIALPPAAGAPAMTPKDEQNSRMAEREKYLNLLDTTFQLRQAQINLLRQTGQLQVWLRGAAAAPVARP